MIINSQKDAILFVENGYATKKILVHQSNLAPEFFDLSSGLAGEVLQKIVNYGIKTAFVVDLKTIKSEPFKQLATETKGMDEYRFFESEEDATKWLQEN